MNVTPYGATGSAVTDVPDGQLYGSKGRPKGPYEGARVEGEVDFGQGPAPGSNGGEGPPQKSEPAAQGCEVPNYWYSLTDEGLAPPEGAGVVAEAADCNVPQDSSGLMVNPAGGVAAEVEPPGLIVNTDVVAVKGNDPVADVPAGTVDDK